MDYLKSFATLGTRFLRPADYLQRQLGNIRAVVFDWDGVFNDGWKDLDGGSPFSEVDSMGVNLLRFSLWQREQVLPPFAVITGQQNPHAQRFAEREHFEGIYMGYSNKTEAFAAFLEKHKLDARQVAFFFDDVLDLPVARQCGLRIMIKRLSSPLFENYVVAGRDADLLTHFSGGDHGLREACELLMALSGRHAETIEHRVKFSETYQAYLTHRAAVNTEVVSPFRNH
jgi:3-deoxy-D-manno-octulosonate 8-phosphate phosphatase (KDO 8-P phosphatase)